ncbi:hypothetical protein PFISCL1PPCAC_22461, partial [Pristionchus fissidentatus]
RSIPPTTVSTMLLGLLIGLSIPLICATTPHWSEQDESDRISAIMAAEKRAFDDEMKTQQQVRNNIHYLIYRFFQARYRMEHQQNYGGEYSDQEEYDRRYRGRQKAKTTTTEAPSYEALSSSSSENSRSRDNWCYFCASPLSSLSSNSRKAVEQFLDIRRTTFPKEATSRECLAPRNFTALQKQDCKHRFCQTLVLMDHEEGSSFVMRGCAEHFGAIHKELLEAREDNSCKRLHDKLDIRECICKNRKSCYAGRERSSTSLRSALPTVIMVALYRLI